MPLAEAAPSGIIGKLTGIQSLHSPGLSKIWRSSITTFATGLDESMTTVKGMFTWGEPRSNELLGPGKLASTRSCLTFT